MNIRTGMLVRIILNNIGPEIYGSLWEATISDGTEDSMGKGIEVKHGSGEIRVDFQCEHQNGLLYVVPSEANWVCESENMHTHSIAGFLTELINMEDPLVRALMQRWGLYYRSRPLDADIG